MYLLNIFFTTILPIIIIACGVIAFFGIIIYFRRKDKKETKKQVSSPGSNIKLIDEYCSKEEMEFLVALHKAMPIDLIAFPAICLGKIVEPKGNKLQYNKVYTKYVDICVFLRKTMQPVLVLDLISPSPVKQAMKELDQDVVDTLKYVKLPLLKTKIKDSYNIEELRQEILNALPDRIIATLIK